MTVQDWLRSAIEDAERRGLPALKPLLEALAKSTAALREAYEWSRVSAGEARPERSESE